MIAIPFEVRASCSVASAHLLHSISMHSMLVTQNGYELPDAGLLRMAMMTMMAMMAMIQNPTRIFVSQKGISRVFVQVHP
jgi:hypothetical protein